MNDIDSPLGTVVSSTKHNIVTPVMTAIGQSGFTKDRSYSPGEPLRTVVTKAEQIVVEPQLAPYIMYNNQNNVPGGVTEPLQTVTTGNRSFYTAASLLQYHSETAKAEVGGQELDKPLLTIDTQPRYALQVAHISKYFGGVTGTKADSPLPTITVVDHNAISAAHLTEYYGNSKDGLPITDPMHTVTSKDREGVVESHLCVLRNNMDCKPHKEPISTIATSPGHFAEIRTYLQKVGSGTEFHNWHYIREMLNQYCDYHIADDEVLILEINGIKYFISDIGMRMLEPKELYAGQGFPLDYIIAKDYTGKAYPKSKQVARCGNAVPPAFAEALVRANLPEMCGEKITSMEQFNKTVAV